MSVFFAVYCTVQFGIYLWFAIVSCIEETTPARLIGADSGISIYNLLVILLILPTFVIYYPFREIFGYIRNPAGKIHNFMKTPVKDLVKFRIRIERD